MCFTRITVWKNWKFTLTQKSKLKVHQNFTEFLQKISRVKFRNLQTVNVIILISQSPWTLIDKLLSVSFFCSILQSKGLSKVSSSITLGGKPQSAIQGSKIAQHSHSMSNLRKASISGPSVPLNDRIGGSSSNFYVPKNEYG